MSRIDNPKEFLSLAVHNLEQDKDVQDYYPVFWLPLVLYVLFFLWLSVSEQLKQNPGFQHTIIQH